MHRWLLAPLAGLVMLSSETLAHGGGLDRNGGHFNRSTGDYHYHSGEHQYSPKSTPRRKRTSALCPAIACLGVLGLIFWGMSGNRRH